MKISEHHAVEDGISRKPKAFYITCDEVASYHDGNAVYITPSKTDEEICAYSA